MSEDEYAAALFAILANPAPGGIDPDDPYRQADDGIDRYDGFGTEVRVETVRADADGELVVGFVVDAPDGSLHGSVTLPFEPEWLRLSGYADPAAYAPEVAREVMAAATRTAQQGEPAHPPVSRERLPSRDEQWTLLLSALADEGPVREVAPGRIEVDVPGDDGRPRVLTVLITPDGWEELLRDWGADADDVTELIGSAVGSVDDDELFLVRYRDRLCGSTREDLPPVRGRALERRIAAARAQNPDAGFGWFAHPPEH